MTRKCEICGIRNIGSKHGIAYGDVDQARTLGYCIPCMAEADWENAHSDYGHDDPDAVAKGYDTQGSLDSCWVCHPELNRATPDNVAGTGHTNTVAKSYTSHAGHRHPRTPEARRLCRKSMALTGQPYDEIVARREQEIDDAFDDEN